MELRKERLTYIDNLRLWVIGMVVVLHLAVTYSGFGSWYYVEPRPFGVISNALFGFFLSFTQGYFMGFMFLLAGFFVPGAYDRKGFGRFIRDRLVRLGLPTLLYMLVINPFMLYVQLDLAWIRPKPGFLAFYSDYVASLDFLSGSGPLWFAFALLIFSIIYALIRLLGKGQTKETKSQIKPSFKNAMMLIVLIAVVAFSFRLVQPIGTDIMNMQISFFSQYIILFILGCLAYRMNIFSQIPYKTGIRWLVSAIAIGFPLWAGIMLFGGALQGDNSYCGGLNWQAAAYALWESFVSVAVCMGLIALFKEKYNKQSKLVKTMSDSAFTVYVFHAPIIVAITQWFSPVQLLPIVKWILMIVVNLPLCFALSHYLIRKTPLLKRVL